MDFFFLLPSVMISILGDSGTVSYSLHTKQAWNKMQVRTKQDSIKSTCPGMRKHCHHHSDLFLPGF